MSHRFVPRRKTDKKVFRHTASNSKAINVMPRIMRGGIRL